MNIDDIRKIIASDDELKNKKINDSDLLIVKRYLDIRNEIIDGYIAKLVFEPYVEIIYIPTKEKERENLRKKLLNHINHFDHDVYLQDATLTEFAVISDDRIKVIEQANHFLIEYKEKGYSKGLYIHGKYSSGKTYLLSAIANELAKDNVNVILTFLPDLVRSIKQGINDRDLEEKINMLKKIDVLMLDDLGGENLTAWFRDEILLPIIQYRLYAKLPIFISSNLKMAELLNSLSFAKSSEIDYVKALRLVQRIKDLTIYTELSDLEYKGLVNKN